MPPKALEELEDDEEGQGAREISDKDDDVRGAGEDDEIDVDKPSDDDAPEDKKARRAARYTEIENRAAAAEERARAADERASRLEAQFQGFQQGQRRDEGPKDDGYDARIKDLTDKRAQRLQLIRSAVGDEAATNSLARESMELEQQIGDLRTERAIKKHMAENQQPSANVAMGILQSETPQVYENPRMKSYARGEFDRLVEMGSPPTIETARKANQTAMRAFGLTRGPAPRPAESQQRAVGGMSSGGGAPTPTGKVKLSKSLRKIAAARSALMSPNEDDGVATKKFAKRLREKGIA